MTLLILLLTLVVGFTSQASARGPGWSLSMPVFKDDGDNRVPFKVQVGSTSVVALIDPDDLQDRAILITNPSASYNLMLGTCSIFDIIDSYWTVPKGSGSYITSNHGPLFALYPPSSSTETIRILVEKQ
jgi:hypothetical protein